MPLTYSKLCACKAYLHHARLMCIVSRPTDINYHLYVSQSDGMEYNHAKYEVNESIMIPY